MSSRGAKMNASEFQFNYIQKNPSESTGTLTGTFLDSEAEPACLPLLSTLLRSHHLHSFLGKGY